MTLVHSARCFALAATVGVLGLSGLARAQTPAEQVLPPTTVGFLKFKNASDLREAVKSTQIGQLLADPALKPLIDDVVAKLDDARAQAREQLGMSLEEILTLPEGEVAIGVIPTPDSTTPVAIYAVADAGANVEKMDALMAKASEIAANEGVAASDETFEGLTLHVLKGEDDNPPVAWTKNGSTYHYATNVDVLKDIVLNAKGRTDSLGSNATFQTIIEKAGSDAQVVWFIDLVQAGSVALKALRDQDQGNAMVLQNQAQLTGLDGIKGAGGGIAFNVGPYDQVAKTFLYVPGELKGILPLFKMPKVDLTPQPWVPASAASYQSISWDLDAFYSGLKKFIDTNIGAGMLEGIEQQLGGPQGNGLRFERDLFGPLGNRITIVGDYATPGDETSQRALFAVALDDQEAFRATLEKVKGLVNAQLPERKFEGTTIYEIEIPEMPNAPGGANVNFDGPLSLAIAKDHLFVATKASILEAVLSASGPGLLQSPAYQAVAGQYPDTSSTLSFTRSEEQARVLYNLIKSGQLSSAIRDAARNAGNELPEGEVIDPDKLPAFEVFEKYVAPGGGFGSMDADGVTFTQFVLKGDTP